MSDLDALDRQRADYLVALYQLAGPSAMKSPRNSEVSSAIGVERDEGSEVALWLKQRGLIGSMTFGDSALQLSPAGADEAERLLRARRESLSQASSVTALTPVEVRRVEAALTALAREEIADKLEGDDLAEYESDLATVEAQIRSPRPKREIVSVALKRLGLFALQFGSGVAASVVANAIG